MIRALMVACTLLALATLGACAGTPSITIAPSSSPAPSTGAQSGALLDPQGNVVMYVTNQSIAQGRVDIAIDVDGRPVVDRQFAAGSGHNFKQYVLRLASGRHVLTAHSLTGKASLRRAFFVNGKQWLVVSYWYSTKAQGTPEPRQFDFRIQDHPMFFD